MTEESTEAGMMEALSTPAHLFAVDPFPPHPAGRSLEWYLANFLRRQSPLVRFLNPTPDRVRLRFSVGHVAPRPEYSEKGASYQKIRPEEQCAWVECFVEPGGEIELPLEFARAVHKFNAEGVIIGGMAPALVNVKLSHKLHPSLDPKEQARQAAEDAARARKEKKAR